MLRLLLPPNLATAAPRDAIALKVELNLAAGAPPSELLPALALLQKWCGPQPPNFLQLKRAQLRQLIEVLRGQLVALRTTLSGDSSAADVRAAADKVTAELTSGVRSVFAGPLLRQDGSVGVPAGATASDQELMSMGWFVQGVEGLLPAGGK